MNRLTSSGRPVKHWVSHFGLTMIIGLFAGVIVVFSVAAVNEYDKYRWPFAYNEAWTLTQQWNGATSHKTSNSLFYAVDMDKDRTSRPVYAAVQGSA